MIVCMLVVIISRVRSLPALAMTVLTAPLGLAGVAPTLLVFHQPFGRDAFLWPIAPTGILMRNTLILIGQIKTNHDEGLDTFHTVVEPTVQRSRPVTLTALAAVLAFMSLTFSVFWDTLACTLIGTELIPEALIKLWLGHGKKGVTEQSYIKIVGRVDVRRNYVESVGLGFNHVPGVPRPSLENAA